LGETIFITLLNVAVFALNHINISCSSTNLCGKLVLFAFPFLMLYGNIVESMMWISGDQNSYGLTFDSFHTTISAFLTLFVYWNLGFLYVFIPTIFVLIAMRLVKPKFFEDDKRDND
jgi:hypothetical protein